MYENLPSCTFYIGISVVTVVVVDELQTHLKKTTFSILFRKPRAQAQGLQRRMEKLNKLSKNTIDIFFCIFLPFI